MSIFLPGRFNLSQNMRVHAKSYVKTLLLIRSKLFFSDFARRFYIDYRNRAVHVSTGRINAS